MIQNLDIIYAVTGQSLVFRAPEGVATSITSTVHENSDGDDDTAELATSGSAAASTVATTLDAAAGSDEQFERVIGVASTTGFKRLGRYLITNATGEEETVEASAVESGVSITSRHRLKNAYASGDSIVATEISHALETSWISDKNNISPPEPGARYRWRLQYTAAGEIRVHNIYFDLVRESGHTTVTALDVDLNYPWLSFLENLPDAHREDRGDGIIKEAYRQVKLDIAKVGKADEAARNREAMEDLVIHKAAFIVAGADFDASERIKSNYDTAFQSLFVGGRIEADADGSGAAKPSKKVPLYQR